MTNFLGPLIDVQDDLSLAQIYAEKARVMCDDLEQDFFARREKPEGLTAQDRTLICYTYPVAGVKNDILSDYILSLEEQLSIIAKRLETLQETMKKEDEPDG